MTDSAKQGVFDKKKRFLRKCRECPTLFGTNRKDRRFCCDKCRNKNWVKLNPRIKLDDGSA